MLDILYQIIIQPIYLLLELLFKFLFDASNYHIIPTIIMMSFFVSVLCLPLYLRAEAISDEEAQVKKKLENKVNIIKKNFRGDERQLLLQTYYKQNRYHPIMALRSSFSLLLQIPFFIAAYAFFTHIDLSNMNVGGFILNNLAKPDATISIGNITINGLPILMTLVNIIAGYIYAKNKSFKENLNIYIISLVFLVILYNQPSGLVFYWLFNNIFSLIKNILLKICAPQKLLKYTILVAIFTIYLCFKGFHLNFDIILVGLLLTLIPIASDKLKFLNLNLEPKTLYWLSSGAFVVLIGILIPSNVLASSPLEFLSEATHPLQILITPLLNAFGIFIFWGGVLWMLANKNMQKILGGFACIILFFAIVNMIMVPLPKSVLLYNLAFDAKNISFFFEKWSDKLIYIGILVAILTVSTNLILKNNVKTLKTFILGISITGLLLSSNNIFKIYTLVKNNKISEEQNFEKYFHFSQQGENVLLIFADRAISSFLPLLLAERPELNKTYSGFTYYPNTVSLYRATSMAYPPLIGGYEYTPLAIAKSSNTYEQDYNEAISVLPLIFKKNNWDVTVTDIPWYDYEIKFVHTDNVLSKNGINYQPYRNNLSKYLESRHSDKETAFTFTQTKRNFILYSLAMTSPGRIRKYIYNRGRYLEFGLFQPFMSKEFILNYGALEILPQLTDFNSNKNNLIVLNNDIMHSSSSLKFPEYRLVNPSELKNQKINQIYNLNSEALYAYHSFAAGIILIGKYLDYMKKNDVYDNTRIIIVSDHGHYINNSEINDEFFNEHTIRYNPLLLVKDFNQRGPIKTSKDFMTNADTPTIALNNIIQNPKNPYTNKLISSEAKKNGIYIMEADIQWQPKLFLNKTNPLDNDRKFSFVKSDIYKKENWVINIPYTKVKKQFGIK